MSYVVVYDHKYGHDVWVERTKVDATRSIIVVILKWLRDYSEEEQKDVLVNISEGKFSEAISRYCEFSEEGFEILEDTPTEKPLDRKEIIRGAKRRLSEMKNNP